MILDRVTITGADDSVDPRALSKLSERFPFVEWGLLFSEKRQGTPRYPSLNWMLKLQEVRAHRSRVNLHPMSLSAHLCGKYVREFVKEGLFTFADRVPLSTFQRIQLNFHAELHEAHPGFAATLRLLDNYQWILQHDGVNDGLIRLFSDDKDLYVYPLFDRSGGTGVVPGAWPAPIAKYQGYAGGLGPDNLEEELRRIKAAAGSARIWVDMETRVRSADDEVLDLAKVERCLIIAKPFVEEGEYS